MKRLWFLLIFGYSTCAAAMSWMDLWLRPDQQGVRLLEQGKAEEAAKTFKDKQWQGAALYRAGHYHEALQQFKQLDTADAKFNQGNALALQGDYQSALRAYEEVLKIAPQHADAKYNYELVKQLLQQQTSQNNQSNKNDQQQNSKQQQSQNHSPSENKQQQQDSKQSSQDNNQANQADNKQQDAPQKNSQSEADKNESNEQNTISNDKKSENVKKQTEQTDKKVIPTEIQQANEQWLRQIPDDPGGLLRQKFLRDYERMQR